MNKHFKERNVIKEYASLGKNIILNKCDVSNCNSNYESSVAVEGPVKCYGFQRNDTATNLCLQKIPRENLSVIKSTVVCIKHFNKSDVIKENTTSGKDGQQNMKVARTV